MESKKIFLLRYSDDGYDQIFGIFDNYEDCRRIMDHWVAIDPGDAYYRGDEWAVDVYYLNELVPNAKDLFETCRLEEINCLKDEEDF